MVVSAMKRITSITGRWPNWKALVDNGEEVFIRIRWGVGVVTIEFPIRDTWEGVTGIEECKQALREVGYKVE